MCRTLLFILLAVFLGAHGDRLNPIVVENGSHFVRGDDNGVSVHQPSGNDLFFPAGSTSGNKKRDSGWMADTWTTATMNYYSAFWEVPPAPENNTGQILFYFNSFESAATNDILQPVLQFNNIIGGWSLSSWYGQPDGSYFHSNPVSVSTGATIQGVISISNNVWSILGYVNGALTTTITVAYTTVGAQGNAQFAMEVYSVYACDNYPPTNSIIAYGIVLEENGATITPDWSSGTGGGHCGAASYVASTSANNVQITWNSGSSTPSLSPGSVGVDISGGDFAVGQAPSAMACAQQCDSTSSCAGWSWAYPASGCSGNTNQCWLKSTVDTRATSTCRESGVVMGQAGVDRSGSDLANMPLNLGAAATSATCAAECAANSQCVAWAFAAPSCGGSSCWLKSAIPAATSNGCRISGIKGNVGVDIPGNDMAGSPLTLGSGATATTCHNQCASTSGCVGWAFVNPQSGCETTNLCWLKSAVGASNSNACRISGTV